MTMAAIPCIEIDRRLRLNFEQKEFPAGFFLPLQRQKLSLSTLLLRRSSVFSSITINLAKKLVAGILKLKSVRLCFVQSKAV